MRNRRFRGPIDGPTSTLRPVLNRSWTVRALAAAATLSLVLPLCICGANLAAAHTSPPGAHASVRTTPRVLHRVVWATPNVAGIHLTSAKVGGSGLRHIYNSKSGAVLYLSLDRQGRRVAFAPWFTEDRDPLPVMEVVPVLGGKVKKPLASYPSKFDWVAGIGWSPSGRRLAFEGGVVNGTPEDGVGDSRGGQELPRHMELITLTDSPARRLVVCSMPVGTAEPQDDDEPPAA